MKLCSINNLKENDILARDVMADKYNVLLYKDTVLTNNHIERLKKRDITQVYIRNDIPEEEIVAIKKEVEEMSRSQLVEIIQKHTYNNGSTLAHIKDAADIIINDILEDESIIENIYDIKERSADIYTHSISICVLSTLVALKLRLTKEQVRDIGVGCLLHDLGLRYLLMDYENQDVESMSKKEFEEYRKHPVYGYTLLKNEDWLSKISKDIILCHHEKIDGSGYPLRAKNISVETRIVSVCDVFDEMICGIGRKKMKIYEAVEYLKGFKNIQYDGRIIDALLTFTAIYPTGTIVITNEGEEAVVIGQNKYFCERPILKILKDNQGNPVSEEKIIDLVKIKHIFIDSVPE